MAKPVLVTVRKALIAKIAALAAYSGADWDVNYQWKLSSPARQRIWTRNGRAVFSSASMRAGRNYRDEDGHFELVFMSEQPAESMETVADGLITSAQTAEEWIGDNKTGAALSVSGLEWIVIEGDAQLKEAYTDSAYIAEWSIPVHYRARIT